MKPPKYIAILIAAINDVEGIRGGMSGSPTEV
jgi:hypothetical protein